MGPKEMIETLTPGDRTKVGVKMSGGTDSSLAAFLLVEKFVQEEEDIEIIPIVIIEPRAPFQLEFVQKITSFIESKFEFHFNKPEVFQLDRDDKLEFMRSIENQLFEKEVVDLIVSGITREPLDPNFITTGSPNDGRDKECTTYLWDNRIFTPFVNFDKKVIAQSYKGNTILEEMFDLTRSCIAPTNDFSTHCGKCWWCRERFWAFGRL